MNILCADFERTIDGVYISTSRRISDRDLDVFFSANDKVITYVVSEVDSVKQILSLLQDAKSKLGVK